MKIPSSVPDFLDSYHHFYILGHSDPDGDCIASQLVLSSYLQRRGRQVELLNPGPFSRPEIEMYAQDFIPEPPKRTHSDQTAVIVVDCSTPARLEGLSLLLDTCPSLVIDHHASGQAFGDLRWIDAHSPSVTYMIQLLIEALDQPTPEEARLLLFGLGTDTGYFRHLDTGSAPVFAAVSRLVAAGASPKEAYSQYSGSWGLGKVKLLARTLERSLFYLDGRVLLTWQTLEDLEQVGDTARGADTLYRILQTVGGCEVVVFFQEEASEKWAVGLRSKDLDIGSLASSLGGGGHPLAAGYQAQGCLRDVQKMLLEKLAALF